MVHEKQSELESPMREPGIVFDFDGVLVDSESVHERALLAAAAKLGMTAIRDERPGRYVGLGDVEAFERIAAANGRQLSADEMTLLIAMKGVAFGAASNAGAIDAYPGAVALLREASAAGHPVAVCSGSRRDDIEPILESLGVLPLLATVVSADDVEKTKPDPAPYLLVADRLGLSPARCLALEDSPAGITAALAAGLRVHALCHTFGPERLAGAHRIHDGISGLTLAALLSGA